MDFSDLLDKYVIVNRISKPKITGIIRNITSVGICVETESGDEFIKYESISVVSEEEAIKELFEDDTDHNCWSKRPDPFTNRNRQCLPLATIALNKHPDEQHGHEQVLKIAGIYRTYQRAKFDDEYVLNGERHHQNDDAPYIEPVGL